MSRQASFKRLSVPQIDFVSPPRRSPRWRVLVRDTMKIIEKAKYIKSGETVLDRSTRFTIKEVRVNADDGGIVFIDVEGAGHGIYHPDEYLGVGEELAREYAATYGWQIAEEFCRLPNARSDVTH